MLKFLLFMVKVMGCWGSVLRVFSRILVGIVILLFVLVIILIFVVMEVFRLVVVIWSLLLLMVKRKFFRIGSIGFELIVLFVICRCLSNFDEEMLNFIGIFVRVWEFVEFGGLFFYGYVGLFCWWLVCKYYSK